MNVNNTGRQFIKNHEGIINPVDDDGFGNLTAGYGHKVIFSDRLKAGQRLSNSQIVKM